LKPPRPKNTGKLGHLWTFFLPVYFLAAVALDLSEVTNREYRQFVLTTRYPPPEHWVDGHYPAGKDDDPVTLVNFHDAVSYCRFVGRRLPAVEEWKSICDGGKLTKRGDVWEWTSTDVDLGGQTYKALCGPSNSCDCSHRYLPHWKNQVKGFRCVQGSTPVTWLPMFLGKEVFS
jgi:formylglycine-generating enzyme required for sulfatase activity